jgi:hypothetical protein
MQQPMHHGFMWKHSPFCKADTQFGLHFTQLYLKKSHEGSVVNIFRIIYSWSNFVINKAVMNFVPQTVISKARIWETRGSYPPIKTPSLFPNHIGEVRNFHIIPRSFASQVLQQISSLKNIGLQSCIPVLSSFVFFSIFFTSALRSIRQLSNKTTSHFLVELYFFMLASRKISWLTTKNIPSP